MKTKHAECSYCNRERECVKLKYGLFICRECDQEPVETPEDIAARKRRKRDLSFGIHPRRRTR